MKTKNRPIAPISDKDIIELRKWCFDRALTERNSIIMTIREKEEASLDDFFTEMLRISERIKDWVLTGDFTQNPSL